jgi:ABC-type uncharacterized transport system substrate-binding protein
MQGKSKQVLRLVEKRLKQALFDGQSVLFFGSRQTGKTTLIQKILQGVPADLPVHTAQNFELLVDQRTARALGIGVPSSVLAQATEVIE